MSTPTFAAGAFGVFLIPPWLHRSTAAKEFKDLSLLLLLRLLLPLRTVVPPPARHHYRLQA